MKTKLVYSAFFIASFINAQQYRDLIIFIGSDSKKNFKEDKPGALLRELVWAIASESAPILVQKMLYFELMGFKLQSFQDVKTCSDQFALLESMKRNRKLNKQDAQDNFFEGYIFYQLRLFNSDWYLLDCLDTSFLLLLPKKYIKKTLGYCNLQFSQEEQERLGLNIIETKILPLPKFNNKVVTEKLYAVIEEDYLAEKASVFAQKDLEQIIKSAPFDAHTGDFLYSWNIACSGHGLPGTKMVSMRIEEFKKMLIFFNSIKTNLVYYGTCFGGVGNMELLFDDTKGFDFDLISSTMLDATNRVEGKCAKNWIISTVFMPEPTERFDLFFERIEKGRSLEDIGAALAGKFSKTHNCLGVCRRRNIHFVPGNTDPTTKIITNTKHQIHAIKHTPIFVEDKQTAIIYPPILSVPIHLENEKRSEVVLMGRINDAADVTHYLPELYVRSKKRFLENTFVNDLEYAQDRTLLVKRLVFLKKRRLHNDVVFRIPKEITQKTPLQIYEKDSQNVYYRTTNFKDQLDTTMEEHRSLVSMDKYFDEFSQSSREFQLQAKSLAECFNKPNQKIESSNTAKINCGIM